MPYIGLTPTSVPESNTVTSASIVDGAISTIDITDDAITTAKIADGAITTAKIAGNAVVTADIADGAVTSVKMSSTGVLPVTYGNATSIPSLTVDSAGRITTGTSFPLTTAATEGSLSLINSGVI